ncbi:PREDICTED: rho GTPase-activating protein 19 [Ceratosolen solmsi marchali]|uniref:Rho GTPase-activating protein 19 n=1 Tax=Ceratosolen solmsi marchali TaxID=326594 RepID=A0AAJ6VKY4_9HYME|nr:PREDICTED: rho GTPase-activating protein 19 [Ceratosolen solmsi marchali]
MEDFNDGMDGKLASRMRKVNYDQFHTLVKMHLSFELDLNTEENDMVAEKAKLRKWSIPHFSKKFKSTPILQKGPEGAALTKEGINQVKQLVEYLSKEHCIIQEGIFRRTGKLTRQQELKNALYQGLRLDLDEGRFSVHDYASVLKGFLADLPEPLLTDLHYPAHCQIAELSSSSSNGNDCRLLRSLQLLLLLLPPPNRIVLKHILHLLNKTAAHENSNKMNCDTLATLFTPHLLCPRKLSPEALHVNSQNLSGLVAFMIKTGNNLFDIPPKLSTDIRAFWIEQEKKLLSPQKADPNESTTDATDTAHTVFSFVDRNLTAKATAAQDTQAALAQLYAHIQSMPESAKKRRLVKQFNKENGQGTPRHVKNSAASKSFGDSIKKRIFQKKLLNHKKIIDVKLGCNFSRSSSEENIISSETMMTPRSRKPVIMISASNLCGLATLNDCSMQYNSTSSLQTPNFDFINRNSCASILEESPLTSSSDFIANSNAGENKENIEKVDALPVLRQGSPACLDDDMHGSTMQKSTIVSTTNTFKEYYLSRSVLTASPVDLSFTSRTGDFEQSESDLNILAEEGNNPSSDTSGIASGSTNSMNNSTEKVDEAITSPRKRCTSLQRNDSKRSIKDDLICDKLKMNNKILKQKQLSESILSSIKVKDSLPETSF